MKIRRERERRRERKVYGKTCKHHGALWTCAVQCSEVVRSSLITPSISPFASIASTRPSKSLLSTRSTHYVNIYINIYIYLISPPILLFSRSYFLCLREPSGMSNFGTEMIKEVLRCLVAGWLPFAPIRTAGVGPRTLRPWVAFSEPTRYWRAFRTSL